MKLMKALLLIEKYKSKQIIPDHEQEVSFG
jgi:hypothetical protein